MKIFTFFNEKGGTGKTTLTVLFASWLAYCKKHNVRVVDCDYPSFQLAAMRKLEVAYMKENPLSPMARLATLSAPYPLGKAMVKERFAKADLERIASEIRRQCSGDGYMLLDFPGRFLAGDPAYDLIQRGMIDLIAFPIDTDRQSRAAALNTWREIRKINPSQKMVFVWNRETAQERRGTKDWYSAADAAFRGAGIEVAATRVRDVLIARRDSTTFGFIRSTMCFPEANVRRACPSLLPLFEEMKARLDGTFTKDMYARLRALKDLRDLQEENNGSINEGGNTDAKKENDN